ncbi:MAG: phosphoribosylglycinamide formyltransferase [Bacteroidales bacterium]|nr:phosphoribosylglycinamide formyltransferase [Bacteroidales bacterium]
MKDNLQIPFRLALFASGNGTNAERIARYFQGHPAITVGPVFYNRKQAFVATRAAHLGLEAIYLPDSRLKAPDDVLNLLQSHGVTHIVLAGYLSLIPAYLTAAYPRRIVNIHPALLPNYGGKGMYGHHVHEAVAAAGEKESGITIHLVDEHYDRGDILFQARCALMPEDTPERIAEKVHELEYRHFPEVIEQWVLQTLPPFINR